MSEITCPNCNTILDKQRDEELTVFKCNSCAGIWVPGNTISRYLKSMGNAPDLFAKPVYDEGASEPLSARNCPSCIDEILVVNSYRGFEIDICQKCNGVFFDKDEYESALPDRSITRDINAATVGIEAIGEAIIAVLRIVP